MAADRETYWYWYTSGVTSESKLDEMRKFQLRDVLDFGSEVPEFEFDSDALVEAACLHLSVHQISLRGAWEHVKCCEACLTWARKKKHLWELATDQCLRAGGTNLEEFRRAVERPRREEMRKHLGMSVRKGN